MIHAVCDFCGRDAGRAANLLSITPFQNFARYHTDSSPYGSVGETKGFVICHACMGKHGLPNPYRGYAGTGSQCIAYAGCLDGCAGGPENKP